MNRDQAIKILTEMQFAERTDFAHDPLFAFGYSDEYKALEFAIETLEQLPEHKTGRWRPVQIGGWHGFECTVCKINREVPCSNHGVPQWKYCPDCGAKMENTQ